MEGAELLPKLAEGATVLPKPPAPNPAEGDDVEPKRFVDEVPPPNVLPPKPALVAAPKLLVPVELPNPPDVLPKLELVAPNPLEVEKGLAVLPKEEKTMLK